MRGQEKCFPRAPCSKLTPSRVSGGGVTAPTLTTARLTLRPHLPSDLDEMAEMMADPAFAAPIGVPPATREEVWHRLLRYMAHWPVMGFGHWVVRDTASGAYLGDVGLMESRRATSPGFEGTPEAAWGFRPSAHGRGYAREACAAMLGWADEGGIARTVCIIAPGNAPSVRLAERLGYLPAGPMRYRDAPILFFERRREVLTDANR